ncbi:MAG: DNA internalization-related competence protein ComEC/Rec2, partial [Vicinamibacterales bacterium]
RQRALSLSNGPALIPAIGLIAGTTAGVYLAAPIDGVLRVLVVLGWGSAVVAFVRHRSDVLTVCLLAAFAIGGWAVAATTSAKALHSPLRTAFEREKERSLLERTVAASVEGTLREDATARPWGTSLTVQVDRLRIGTSWRTTSGGLRASVTGSLVAAHMNGWRAGRRVRFPVQLRRPSRYLNRGVPDDEVLLARRGVALVGSVKSAALVEVLDCGNWYEEAAAALRHWIRQRIAQSVGQWDEVSAAIVTAVLIGDRTGLDESLERRLQTAGTYHVIAISGGNIAILTLLMLAVFRTVRLPPRAGAVVAILLLIAYAWLVGLQSSVSRSTVMAVAYLAARVLDHRTDTINALAVAVVAILWVSPISIADTGFVLTCGATLGIVLGARWCWSFAPRSSWMAAPLVLFRASLCAEMALLPVNVFVFSRVTFAGLVLNFMAVPLMVVGQIAGLVALAVAPIQTTVAAQVGWIAHLATAGLIRSAGWVELMPWVSYRLPPPAPLTVMTYYASLGTFLLAATPWAQSRWPVGRAPVVRRAAGSVAVLAWLWILTEPVTAITDSVGRGRRLEISFVDVGQGDSTLVRFPGGASLLVDAGGGSDQFDMGARVVSPTLWASGVRQLATLAITHGDPDHLGGAPSVLRDFAARGVWDGVPVPPHKAMQAFRRLADSRAVAWQTLQRGDRFRLGGADVHVWNPPLPDWERQRVRNDDSIVLEIRYGAVSIVLPGDIGAAVERVLAPHFAPAGLRVLKAAHHGSATSTSIEFLEALRPSIVVFSCGRDNPHGHPVPQVLRRVEEIGAAIFRTDRHGQISLETDGKTVTIHPYVGKTVELTASIP